MSTWTEELTEVFMDLLAHARGCRHDDHAEEDRKVCTKVAERVIQMTDARVDATIHPRD